MQKNEAQQSGESDRNELDFFIRLANNCCNEALDELKEPFHFLSSIDQLYMDIFSEAGQITPTAIILLLNAHSSWRSGVRLALSGQLLPVFMTLRGSIESSLYAHAIVTTPQLKKVWLDRDSSDESRRKCRQAFSIKRMFQCLEDAHEKGFTDGLREVYESTIDFGAHPNSHSLIRSIQLEEQDNGKHSISFSYIHGARSFELRQALVACADIGIAVLFITLLCSPKHPQLTDLNDRALDLHSKIVIFTQDLGLK